MNQELGLNKVFINNLLIPFSVSTNTMSLLQKCSLIKSVFGRIAYLYINLCFGYN